MSLLNYKYQLDGGSWVGDPTSIPIATSLSLSGLSQGSHTLLVHGQNAYGQWTATPTSISFTVDSQTPTIAPTSLSYQANSGTLEIFADISDASSFDLFLKWKKNSVDLGPEFAITDNQLHALAARQTGNYEAVIRALDAAGNQAIFTYANNITTDPSEIIDDMTFSYPSSQSNKISRIDDVATGVGANKGFEEDTATTQYTYDANGNTISDKNRNINSITYNHLNLPTQIVSSTTVNYAYDEAGQRLMKSDTSGTNYYIRDAAGNLIGEIDSNGDLQYVNLISGNGEVIGQKRYDSGVTNDYYYLKDHLGNNRVTFKDNYKQLQIDEKFNNGTSNWSFNVSYGNSHPNPYEIVTDPDDPSNNAIALRNDTGTSMGYKTFTVGANRHYKLTYRMKVIQKSDSYNFMYFYYVPNEGGVGNYIAAGPFDLNNLEWQTIEYFFTTPAQGATIATNKTYNGSQMVWNYRIHSSTQSNSEVLFDDIELIELESPNENEIEVVSASDYYPFGMVMVGRNTQVPAGNNKFKYQNKERDVAGTQELYDYFEARNYDPAIGRFMQVDPLASSFRGQSPFNAMANNPLNMIDPSGLAPCNVRTSDNYGNSYACEDGLYTGETQHGEGSPLHEQGLNDDGSKKFDGIRIVNQAIHDVKNKALKPIKPIENEISRLAQKYGLSIQESTNLVQWMKENPEDANKILNALNKMSESGVDISNQIAYGGVVAALALPELRAKTVALGVTSIALNIGLGFDMLKTGSLFIQQRYLGGSQIAFQAQFSKTLTIAIAGNVVNNIVGQGAFDLLKWMGSAFQVGMAVGTK